MADEPVISGASPGPPVERLSAVHSVLGIQRQATEFDILITTLVEVLRAGPQTEVDLLIAARRIWPGAGVTSEQLLRALQIGSRAGYFLNAKPDGEPGWALSAGGVQEVESSRDWARDVLEGTAADLRRKVAAAGVEISPETSHVWTRVLEHAVHASVRQAFAAYVGDVQRQSEWWLTPRSFDRDSLIKAIEGSTSESAHSLLMIGLALEAIDPLEPFGNDLVTHITVGYMLHAFMGRRDYIGVRAAIGSLSKSRVILDTPVLLQLLANARQRATTERVIRAATDARMDVVVPVHYLEELTELISRLERDVYPEVAQALNKGTEPGLLASVVDDQAVSLWLAAVEQGEYKSWTDFVNTARALDGRLRVMGVTVREHNNKNPELVARAEEVLAEEASNRGKAQRTRDANTIVMARRARDRLAPDHPFWPGAWVVTTDRHMAKAYERLDPKDQFPVTLTPGRLLGLISTCSTPATAEELAVSAASLLQDDSFLAIAARYPVAVAIGFAQALGPESGGSQLDLRLTQMTPAELMAEQPDFELEGDEASARITAAVMTMRAKRLNLSYEAGAARLRTRADEATMSAQANAQMMTAALRDLQGVEADRDSVQRELAETKQRHADNDVRSGRRLRSRLGYAGITVLAILALLQPNPGWLAFSVLGLLVFWRSAVSWQDNLNLTWKSLVPGALLELVAVAVGFATR